MPDVVLEGAAARPAPVRLRACAHPMARGRALLPSRDVTALEQAEAVRDFVANVSHEIRTPTTRCNAAGSDA